VGFKKKELFAHSRRKKLKSVFDAAHVNVKMLPSSLTVLTADARQWIFWELLHPKNSKQLLWCKI